MQQEQAVDLNVWTEHVCATILELDLEANGWVVIMREGRKDEMTKQRGGEKSEEIQLVLRMEGGKEKLKTV